MSTSKSLKIEDFMKIVQEVRKNIDQSKQLPSSVNELLNQLLQLELQDLLEAKIEQLKKKYQSSSSSSEQRVDIGPLIASDSKSIEALKNLDLDTLIKLKILTSPGSVDSNALLLLTLLSMTSRQNQSQQNQQQGFTLGDLIKLVEKAYEKTPTKEILELYEKIAEKNPTVALLQKELEEIKKKVESSDPVQIIQTIKTIANELGLTNPSSLSYELEKLKLDLEKWKLEQDIKLKKMLWKYRLKKMEEEKEDRKVERLFKYILAPIVKTVVPKVMKFVGKSSGKKLTELTNLPTTKVKCPKCGNEFVVKALPSGVFPDVVTCPFCGLKLVKKLREEQKTQGGESVEKREEERKE